jgi:hypothetical protein
MATPPILDNKNTSSPSIFIPSALLREARRQKNLITVPVPPVCLLDPDGDLVRTLRETGRAKPFAGWPCYHSELDIFSLAGQEVGIVGRAVGASFAVLVAEELFASGCRPLVSLTSAGQITRLDHLRILSSSTGADYLDGRASRHCWFDLDDGCTLSGNG